MNKLNEILYQKRITKAELARKLKISPQRVNNWTCGNNYPNRKYTKLIAEYLDVSIEKLFYDEEVHHINGDTLDNRPENLQLMSRGEHSTYHNNIIKLRKTEIKAQD